MSEIAASRISLFLGRTNFDKTDAGTKLQGSQLMKFNIVQRLLSPFPIAEAQVYNLGPVKFHPGFLNASVRANAELIP